jgi:hypothetical protein
MFGRIRRAEAVIAAAVASDSQADESSLPTANDFDASAFPKPLTAAVEGVPTRTPEAAPLATLST